MIAESRGVCSSGIAGGGEGWDGGQTTDRILPRRSHERISMMLTEDEFRLLAFVRGYADHCEQSLDPLWIREQLEFTLDRFREAARSLADRGLVEFFEWRPDDPAHFPSGIHDGMIPMNMKFTQEGWEYLRRGR